MSHLPIPATAYQHNTLEELFAAATRIGRIYLHQFECGAFHFVIKFNTVAGTLLEAKAGYSTKPLSIREAIIEALENAEKIRSQFK